MSHQASTPERRLNLRSGDVVEVRSREEILATLDADGTLGALPFMPEMLEFCGRRFTVAKRADKTCDTIQHSGLRRMADTVHLENTRCSGAAHGGCEAACQLFWKEAWLKRVPANGRELPVLDSAGAAEGCSEELLTAATRRPTPEGSTDVHYRCQATELLRATQPLPNWEPLQHVRDVRTGNLRPLEALKGIVWWAFRRANQRLPGYRAQIALFNAIQRLRRRPPLYELEGENKRTPTEELGLRPGDLVEVKSAAEIRQTLDKNQKNRGLYFDIEMTPYCGAKHRVRGRVSRIVDEATGKMIEIPGGCVILDDAVCTGRYHLGCPRAIYPYWREIWLRRASNGNDEHTASA